MKIPVTIREYLMLLEAMEKGICDGNADDFSSEEGKRIGNATATNYFAAVNIPHGATITDFEAYIDDANALDDTVVRLMEYTLDGSDNLIAISSLTSDDANNLRSQSGLTHTVDNNTNAYLLKLEIEDATKLISAKVTYTYTAL